MPASGVPPSPPPAHLAPTGTSRQRQLAIIVPRHRRTGPPGQRLITELPPWPRPGESLDVGYRISPRGSLLAALQSLSGGSLRRLLISSEKSGPLGVGSL